MEVTLEIPDKIVNEYARAYQNMLIVDQKLKLEKRRPTPQEWVILKAWTTTGDTLWTHWLRTFTLSKYVYQSM